MKGRRQNKLAARLNLESHPAPHRAPAESLLPLTGTGVDPDTTGGAVSSAARLAGAVRGALGSACSDMTGDWPGQAAPDVDTL